MTASLREAVFISSENFANLFEESEGIAPNYSVSFMQRTEFC